VSSCIYDTYVRAGQSVNRTNMKGQRLLLAHEGQPYSNFPHCRKFE
jgi:hypothetical protein